MKKPDWFKFYPEKWKASRTVRRMSLAARAVYFDLLCEAWHQVPPGTVPNDDAALAELADVKPSVWAKVGDEVRKAFVVGPDGRLHQKFMVEVIAPIGYGRSEKNKVAAEKRWGVEPPKADANAMHMHSKCNASEIPMQCHQEEEREKEESKSNSHSSLAGAAEAVPVDRIAIIDALSAAGFAPQRAIKLAGQPGATLDRVQHFIEQAAKPGVGEPLAFITEAIRQAWPVERFNGPRLVPDDGASERGFADAMARIEAANAKKAKVS